MEKAKEIEEDDNLIRIKELKRDKDRLEELLDLRDNDLKELKTLKSFKNDHEQTMNKLKSQHR